MTQFEKELRNFFAKDTLIEDKVYFDKTLTGRLNDTTNIKVCFETKGYADHYYGLTITVINKAHGTVDCVYIKFSDFWGKFKVGPNNTNYHIWDSHNEVSWYCNVPTKKQIEEYVKVVSDYIKLYK